METENASPRQGDPNRYAQTQTAPHALPVEEELARQPKKIFSLEDRETMERLRMTVARVCPRWLDREREDLAQRAMLRLLERERRSKAPVEICASYLFRTAHNIVIDEIRKRRREVLCDEMETQVDAAANQGAFDDLSNPENPEGQVKDQRLRIALLDCLQGLNQNRRVAFTLRTQGHSTKDIAAMLGWDNKKVENNIGRGRKNLQECLLNKGYGLA